MTAPLLLLAACGRVPAGAERVREDPAPAVLAIEAASPDGRVKARAGRWGVRRRGGVESVHHRVEVGTARLDLYARGVALPWRTGCSVRWLAADAVRFACDAGTGAPLEELAITWSGGSWASGGASAATPAGTAASARAPAWIAESVVARLPTGPGGVDAAVLRWRTPEGDRAAVRLADAGGHALTLAPAGAAAVEARAEGPGRLALDLPDGSRLEVEVGRGK